MTGQDDIIQEEILQAALRLYRKSGFAKVTMDNVAKATGRSRSSLYYYFKNRDEIFQAVLGRIAQDVAGAIRNAVTAGTTLNEKISAFCTIKIKTSQEWKVVFTAVDQVLSADEQSKHTKFLDALHKKLIYLENGILMDALSAAGTAPGRQLKNADLDMLSFIISSSVRGIRREIYDHDDPHDVNTAIQLLTGMIVKWIQS